MDKPGKKLIRLRDVLLNKALFLTKGNYADAENLVQEVMCDAHKKNLWGTPNDLKYYIKMLHFF